MAVEKITGLVFEAMEIVWGGWCREEKILAGPINVMKCPVQPNATDCGFYVMNCIQRIYEELLFGLGRTTICECIITLNLFQNHSKSNVMTLVSC
jgi:hypothetical protein